MTETATTAEARHVPSSLMRQTLLDPTLVLPATDRLVIRMLPWLHVLKIGGRSIMDRGRDALLPVVEELRQVYAERRLLIATGPGIRARQVMNVGLDLGLPTGVLAALASTEAEQNGHLLAALLAEDGVGYLPHTVVSHQLSLFLSASPAAVCNGYPPYELFEHPSAAGKIPTHRTDVGVFLLADAYGAESLVYAEDVDGIFTADPNGDESAQLIPQTTAAELIEKNLKTLPIDRLVLELMGAAKHRKQIQVVNGLKPGNIRRALAGEHVGTIVTSD